MAILELFAYFHFLLAIHYLFYCDSNGQFLFPLEALTYFFAAFCLSLYWISDWSSFNEISMADSSWAWFPVFFFKLGNFSFILGLFDFSPFSGSFAIISGFVLLSCEISKYLECCDLLRFAFFMWSWWRIWLQRLSWRYWT